MRAPVILLGLALAGCPTSDPLPGNENMGQYAFIAEPQNLMCGLPDLPPNAFGFTGTFSRNRDGGGMFLTLNGISRDAGFDGQVASSSLASARTFFLPDGGQCGCDMKVTETIAVALLSQSQSSALGDKCPADALDGGVPQEDAGVRLPGSTATGFDSVRACGTLFEEINGTGTCDPLCDCVLRYRLVGERQ